MIAHREPNVQKSSRTIPQDEQRHRTQQTRAVKSIPATTQPSMVQVNYSIKIC